VLRGHLGSLGCTHEDPPGKITSRARAAVANPSSDVEAFRAFHVPDTEPTDVEFEEESRQVGAVLSAVGFEYARESLKSLKTIEAILSAVHLKK
jgi:hypothetical protein